MVVTFRSKLGFFENNKVVSLRLIDALPSDGHSILLVQPDIICSSLRSSLPPVLNVVPVEIDTQTT